MIQCNEDYFIICIQIIAKTKLVELIASETEISKAGKINAIIWDIIFAYDDGVVLTFEDVGKVLETFMGLVKSKVLGEGDEMRLKDFGNDEQLFMNPVVFMNRPIFRLSWSSTHNMFYLSQAPLNKKFLQLARGEIQKLVTT